MTQALAQFIGSARWFGGKDRDFRVAGVRRLGVLPGPPVVAIEEATIEYADGSTERYQLPLVYYPAPEYRLDHAFVGAWDDEDFGPVHAYDALHDRRATALWLAAFEAAGGSPDGHRVDGATFHRLPGHDLDLEAYSTTFTGEQSNSSVIFGEDSLMKVFRKLTPGHNPDIEIHAALTRSGSDHVAALYGWLEVDGGPGEPPTQLAMLQQYLRTASDGWNLALASVRDLYAEADLHADEVGGDFAAESERLGAAVAQVHAALAAGFPTDTWHTDQLTELAQAMRRRLDAALSVVPQLEAHADGLREAYDALTQVTGEVVVHRVHGDLHLGQTLRTARGWKIVDFEGEPAKTLAERVLPDSPWRDVAGMLRSFDYAAHAVEADLGAGEHGDEQIAYRAAEWAERNRSAFVRAYAAEAAGQDSDRDGAGGAGTDTAAALGTDERTLLRAYEVDKAVYETVYEARNRPDWLPIPLGAIERLTSPAGTTE